MQPDLQFQPLRGSDLSNVSGPMFTSNVQGLPMTFDDEPPLLEGTIGFCKIKFYFVYFSYYRTWN